MRRVIGEKKKNGSWCLRLNEHTILLNICNADAFVSIDQAHALTSHLERNFACYPLFRKCNANPWMLTRRKRKLCTHLLYACLCTPMIDKFCVITQVRILSCNATFRPVHIPPTEGLLHHVATMSRTLLYAPFLEKKQDGASRVQLSAERLRARARRGEQIVCVLSSRTALR